jgi:hypothetical protein
MTGTRGILASALTGLALAAVPATAAAAPRIDAHPSRAMVNTPITLRGTGFPPRRTITLLECGRTFWLAPEEPCDAGNLLRVLTNRRGAFKATMRAEVCPVGEPGRGPTERVCYVGEPEYGEDTATLLGAVAVAVSWP